MAGNGNGTLPPYAKARAAGGLGLYFLVGILAIIDALSPDYTLELGPMGLMLGTATILLGVEGFRRIVGGG